jgi:hypothetical protein
MSPRFVLGGFDVRVWPWDGRITTDSTEWEQAEVYESAKELLGIQENSLQLLDPQNEAQLVRLAELVADSGGRSTLIAIDFLDATVFRSNQKLHPSRLQGWGKWEVLGLDVCDLNGLFSYFCMTEPARSDLSASDLLRGLITVEAANIDIPAHRPFVVSQVRRLIGA